MYKRGIRELLSHQAPEREQRLFKTQQKKGNAYEHIEQSDQDLFQVWYWLSDNQELETEYDRRYR